MALYDTCQNYHMNRDPAWLAANAPWCPNDYWTADWQNVKESVFQKTGLDNIYPTPSKYHTSFEWMENNCGAYFTGPDINEVPISNIEQTRFRHYDPVNGPFTWGTGECWRMDEYPPPYVGSDINALVAQPRWFNELNFTGETWVAEEGSIIPGSSHSARAFGLGTEDSNNGPELLSYHGPSDTRNSTGGSFEYERHSRNYSITASNGFTIDPQYIFRLSMNQWDDSPFRIGSRISTNPTYWVGDASEYFNFICDDRGNPTGFCDYNGDLITSNKIVGPCNTFYGLRITLNWKPYSGLQGPGNIHLGAGIYFSYATCNSSGGITSSEIVYDSDNILEVTAAGTSRFHYSRHWRQKASAPTTLHANNIEFHNPNTTLIE